MAVDGDVKQRGPYIIKIPYTIQGMAHEHTWLCQLESPVEVGADPTDIRLRTRDGAGRTLQDAMTAYWTVAKGLFPTGAIVGQYSLERAQLGTDKTFYVASGVLSGATSGGAWTDSRQLTITFKSGKSGISRLIFLEGPWASDLIVPVNAVAGSPAASEAIAWYATSPNSPMLANDASWLVKPISSGDTQNEAIYKARHRK